MTQYRADRSDAPAPAGSIKYRAEIIHLIEEAKMEPVRIWTVTQSGYLSSFLITSKSVLREPKVLRRDYAVLCSGPEFYCVTNTISEYDGTGPGRKNAEGELLGSYNIESSADACHYAFTNKMIAMRYSDELKNDERYIQSVREWHARFTEMFSDIDDDYDDYD
jgi:hypothetical protein